MTTLSVIVPVYNEEDCIDETVSQLLAVRAQFLARGVQTSFLFIDDGSRDRSVEKLVALGRQHACVQLIKLSRNFGHQLAVTAGLDRADADYVCIIDADLQDPPALMLDMLALAEKEKADIVYGQRRQRAGETFSKKLFAAGFYRVLRWLCRVDIPVDTGDFRLISRKVVLSLRTLRENNRFIRGMIPWMGYKAVPLLYDRAARFAGETRYPFKKSLALALNAIFAFSNKPLRVATYAGGVVMGLSFLGLAALVGLKLFTDTVVPGITVIVATSILLNGFVILMLGVMGEYVGRIFEEVKNRPLYFVDYTVNLDGHRDRQS